MPFIFKHERIKTFRDAHDMSLDEMAAKLGKPKQLIGVWENGINCPSMENLLLICNTFHVEPAFFLTEACDTVHANIKETI